MKKLYFIIGVLCFVLGLSIVGLMYFDNKMENDEEFKNEVMDLYYKAQEDKQDSSGKTTSGIETEKSEESVQIKNNSDYASNPEKDLEGFDELRMDSNLSEEDWERRIEAGITTFAVNDANEECSGLYYFDLLDEFNKQLYLEMYIVLSKYETNVCLCSLDADKIDLAFSSVLFDHPEIFYSNGYVLTKYNVKDEVVRYGFSPMYTMEKSDADEAQIYIDNYTNTFLSGIDKFATEYDKIKYTYEYVIYNTEYDLNSADNQSIVSVMRYNRSVCQGYARAVQYLLTKLGVSSTIVAGYVEGGEGHAWNLVKCNNAYYYIDSTWGDSSFRRSDNASFEGISYDYLNITTAELEKNHVIDNIAEVPICIFTQDNYYVKEGLMFNSIETERLNMAFDEGYRTSKDSVCIKCSSKEVYNDMLKYMVDDNHIFDYVRSGSSSVSYFTNDELYTISFDI